MALVERALALLTNEVRSLIGDVTDNINTWKIQTEQELRATLTTAIDEQVRRVTDAIARIRPIDPAVLLRDRYTVTVINEQGQSQAIQEDFRNISTTISNLRTNFSAGFTQIPTLFEGQSRSVGVEISTNIGTRGYHSIHFNVEFFLNYTIPDGEPGNPPIPVAITRNREFQINTAQNSVALFEFWEELSGRVPSNASGVRYSMRVVVKNNLSIRIL